MTNSDEIAVLRVSDADRNGTLRRLHNAVALGLIDMDEFSERSALVALARQQAELAVLVGDLPAPNAIVTGSADRVVPPADVTSLADKLKQQRGITITQATIEGATHFFDPGMDEMISLVDSYVRRRLTETTR